jgi:fido (protein-threonine AMPylation protein)
VGALLGDTQHWIANDDDRDALCVRVHHRLVHVHPFPNGNGRHARLFADLLAGGLGVEPFSWVRPFRMLQRCGRRTSRRCVLLMWVIRFR